MSSRGRLTLLIAALLVGVIPNAYFNPPDPSWLAGYWDDDDFDNTVAFITGPCAIDVTVPVYAGPVVVAVARLDPADPATCPTPLRSSLHSRAPPSSAPSPRA